METKQDNSGTDFVQQPLSPLPMVQQEPLLEPKTTLIDLENVDSSGLIHFSDGVVPAREFNQLEQDVYNQQIAIPDHLKNIFDNLGIFGKILNSGSLATIKFLQVCRYFGDSFADALGITTPKYEYEIRMYNEMVEQAQKEKKEIEEQYATWKPDSNASTTTNVQINPIVNSDNLQVQ